MNGLAASRLAIASVWALAFGCAGVSDDGETPTPNPGDEEPSSDVVDGWDGSDENCALEAAPVCGQIKVIYRDFSDSHEDFETYVGGKVESGLVAPRLADDCRPELASTGATETVVTSAGTFAQWYRDVDGVNLRFDRELVLDEASDGSYLYSNSDFFPLTGEGFGDEGRAKNFHFTSEIHLVFNYRGGEMFEFTGDDDLWIFINGRLAMDLGGLHLPETGLIDFDAQAAELGIELGKRYRLDIFHAERHTDQSNFAMATTIDCFGGVVQ